MRTEPIRSEAEYIAVLARITRLMGAKKDAAESEELEGLFATVEAYESVHFPIDEPTPEAFSQFLRDQQGAAE